MTMTATPEQLAAVSSLAPEILLLACPGAGKTTTLIERIARMDPAAQAAAIVVTFTNKAAAQLRDKLAARTICVHFVGTLHGLSARILAANDQRPAVITQEQQDAILKELITTLRSKVSLKAVKAALLGRPGPKEEAVVAAYRKRLREADAYDYDALLAAGAQFAAAYNRHPWHLFVDEYQDSGPVDDEVYNTLRCASRFFVGDPDQCQPGNTEVTMTNGRKKQIRNLDDGMTVRAYDRQAGRITGGHPIKVASRNYNGSMLTVSAGNDSTDCTPNHRWLVRWTDRTTRVCVTYLMFRPDLGFRVGWCQLFAQNDGGNSIPLHFFHRCRIEKAEAGWILGIHETRTAASIEESCISVIFQIPTLPFEPVNGASHITRETIAETFRKCRAVANTAGAFAEFNRLPDKPFYTASPSRSRSTFLEITASNLLPGLHSVPVEGGGWKPVSVTRRHFLGTVWSLDVAKHHSYVADGICTLNSIYGFRGATRDNLLCRMGTATVLRLTTNFRSRPEIVNAANQLMDDDPDHRTMQAIRPGIGGLQIQTFDNHYAELAAIVQLVAAGAHAGEEWAVLTRYNHTRREIDDALRSAGAPMPAKPAPRPSDQRVVEAWLALLAAPTNRLAQAEYYRATYPPAVAQRKIEAGQPPLIDYRPLLDWPDMAIRLKSHGVSQGSILRAFTAWQDAGPEPRDILAALREEPPVEKVKGAVTVTTMHGAKGLEFENVWLPALEDIRDSNRDEERRLFYVGMTRAKNTLIMSSAKTRPNAYTGQTERPKKSPFLVELSDFNP